MRYNTKQKILIPAGASVILDTLSSNGFEAYIVGGCVRDQLLGITPHDYDICTSATPEEVKRCFPDRKIVDTGIEHGTVTVFVTTSLGFEVTTFRKESAYSDYRRPDRVELVTDLTVDLSRRDFTMNAMAYNNTAGLVDPFHGIDSIRSKVIACVGDPNLRFREDALRILRALRFASVYGFSISPRTSLAIRKNAELLRHISAERINWELRRILKGENVLYVLETYPDVLGVIIPELAECAGFQQNNRFHCFDVYKHIIHAVANYQQDDDVVNMALLLHDIGKPRCYTEDENGGHFYHHEIPSYAIAQQVVSRLRFDSQSAHDIAELVLYHDAVIEPTPRTVKKWLNKLGERQFFRLMDMQFADMMAHAEGTQDEKMHRTEKAIACADAIIASKQCFTIKDLAINGEDILSDGVPEGPMVGSALKVALAGVIAETVPNEKEALLDYTHRYMAFVRDRTDVRPSDTEPFCPFGCAYCNAAYSDRCYACEDSRLDFLLKGDAP